MSTKNSPRRSLWSLIQTSCLCGCVGGLVGLACTGCGSSCSQSMPTAVTAPSNSQVASKESAPEEMGETKLVSFKVDGMTCPTGCYPVVKSAIAKQKGVVGIELAPQKEADAIDNPIVFVKYKGDLDMDATFKAISRVGFEASEAPAGNAVEGSSDAQGASAPAESSGESSN